MTYNSYEEYLESIKKKLKDNQDDDDSGEDHNLIEYDDAEFDLYEESLFLDIIIPAFFAILATLAIGFKRRVERRQ